MKSLPHAPLVSATLLVLATSCSPGTTKLPGMDRRLVAESIATNVIVPTLERFVTETAELELAVAAYAAAPTDTALRDAARLAFREAMEVAQRLEVMQVGPAGTPPDVMGGLDLRTVYYAYYAQNACLVDGTLATMGYAPESALFGLAVNRRDLTALEYLLFNEGTTSACTANPTLLDGVTDLGAARASYAANAAALVHDAAVTLRDAWTTGGFVANFDADGTGSIYDSGQEALNAITDAMFYLEVETKDMKLAPPMGLTGCTTPTCPGLVESRYAQGSVANMVANVAAFRDMFRGGTASNDQVGIDDLLRSFGQDALVADVYAKLDAVDAAAAAVPVPLEQAVDSHPAETLALYTALQQLATLLKTSFVGTLDLRLPNAAAGDNDS